jgi:hypothetical protein
MPDQLATQVKSLTHNWFGRVAENWRWTRSARGRRPDQRRWAADRAAGHAGDAKGASSRATRSRRPHTLAGSCRQTLAGALHPIVVVAPLSTLGQRGVAPGPRRRLVAPGRGVAGPGRPARSGRSARPQPVTVGIDVAGQLGRRRRPQISLARPSSRTSPSRVAIRSLSWVLVRAADHRPPRPGEPGTCATRSQGRAGGRPW